MSCNNHHIIWYACGKHIKSQCRCASPGKMNTIDDEKCPTCQEEQSRWEAHFKAKEFKPIVQRRALAMRVLCVAKTRLPGHWAAYCGAVPGMKHEEEIEPVLRFGEKMPEEVARALFPEFKDVPYAR